MPLSANHYHIYWILKKNSFNWTPAAATAFEALKKAMVFAPVLALHDFAHPLGIETDDSRTGIGAILMQRGHPVAFINKAVNSRQQAMSIYERELHAILHAVKKWTNTLWAGPLSYALTIGASNSSLNKSYWALYNTRLAKLTSYDLEIKYKKVKDNIAADALSKLPGEEISLRAISSVSTELYQQIRDSWSNDPKLLKIIIDLLKDTMSHPTNISRERDSLGGMAS